VFSILLPMVVVSQDDVQVFCTPDVMTIKVTKAVVETMGFLSNDVHLQDENCAFGNVEEDQFYVYRISPLTVCGTELRLNGSHVEYNNKLIAGNEDEALMKGQVLVGTESKKTQSLAAKLKCIFPVELMVSTSFLPNISLITIPLPDAFGVGEFQASMSLFKSNAYAETYSANPRLYTGDILYIGVQLLGQLTDDIYLRMQRCWATPVENADAENQFGLLEEGCADQYATKNGLEISVNGIQTYARFQVPVFKFVAYDAVWLHCDLQICISERCQPTCASRKRRSNSGYGPEDWAGESHLISVGPITRGDKYAPEEEIEEEIIDEIFEEDTPMLTPFHIAVLIALIAVSTLCITLACFLCKKPSKQ
jgi:hypothetical protein